MNRITALAILTLSIAACGGNANDAAESCGDQTCPPGTAFAEYRAVREGIEIDASVDPLTYSGEVGFKHFSEGECTYTCETIQPCPDQTFPVITAECFTCGVVTADGEVKQGSCGNTARSADTGGW